MIYFASFPSLFSMMLNFYVVRNRVRNASGLFFRQTEFVHSSIIFHFGLDSLLAFACVCAEVYIEC